MHAPSGKPGGWIMSHKLSWVAAALTGCLSLGVLGLISAAGPANATTYTGNPTLADFTASVSQFATLSNFSAGDTSSPYTPTATTVNMGLRVFDGGSITGLPTNNNWILATFPSAVSSILVFPNIDHFGSAFDGYQYNIFGSNNGTTWTPLFDALTVNGSGEPFTLGNSSGTAPQTVNNVLTPGAGPNGTVGYEASFLFPNAFRFYAFGASTIAIADGNADQELSAVGDCCSRPHRRRWIAGLGRSLRCSPGL